MSISHQLGDSPGISPHRTTSRRLPGHVSGALRGGCPAHGLLQAQGAAASKKGVGGTV